MSEASLIDRSVVHGKSVCCVKAPLLDLLHNYTAMHTCTHMHASVCRPSLVSFQVVCSKLAEAGWLAKGRISHRDWGPELHPWMRTYRPFIFEPVPSKAQAFQAEAAFQASPQTLHTLGLHEKMTNTLKQAKSAGQQKSMKHNEV
eukprot:1161563-Pelagomonas_calceolata.AAC.9